MRIPIWQARGLPKIVAFLCLAALPGSGRAVTHITAEQCEKAGGGWFGTLGCELEYPQIDRIVVDKLHRRLFAMRNGRVVKTFRVSLGRKATGDKVREGDHRTPEGIYPIVGRIEHSPYYRSLRLGYPTPSQVAAAKKRGINPGGSIMIHGLPDGYDWLARGTRRYDWTDGCIAVTNDEIDWLYVSVQDGTPVDIRASIGRNAHLSPQ